MILGPSAKNHLVWLEQLWCRVTRMIQEFSWIFLSFALNAITTSKHIRVDLKEVWLSHINPLQQPLCRRGVKLYLPLCYLCTLSSFSQLGLNELLWMQEQGPHQLWLPSDALKFFYLSAFLQLKIKTRTWPEFSSHLFKEKSDILLFLSRNIHQN